MMEYYWPKPGNQEPAAKVSYASMFRPRGWIIGTGIYIDGVNEKVAVEAAASFTRNRFLV